MKLIDEFRDPAAARRLAARIGELAGRLPARPGGRPLQIMEVCGGHTHAIFRYGIEQMLPPSVELVHGPGCPVCVLPRSRVDECVALAERPEVILATFGDAMRVPGSRGSLLQARAAGADVRMVYSPLDALGLARRHPDREIVFFALGFETTMPATAFTVLQAAAEGIGNFSVLCNHITIVPTLEALLESPDLALDGFLGPGHVSMVIGSGPYDFIAARYGKPVVISGFEPLDILQSIWMLLRQLAEGRCAVENQYQRVVADAGNAPAQAAVERVFRVRETCEWRGLGHIERSGVALREAYGAFDAERRHAIAGAPVPDPPECRCGDVLRGALRPRACPAFATTCTPETPIGSLMVSSEGACAAVYQYGGLSPAATT